MTSLAPLFSSPALDVLAFWQNANMPDRALVFTRALTRQPGGVSVESYTFARADPCRLSMPIATESNTDGTLKVSRSWTLIRPASTPALNGTEHVVIVHANGGATAVRVLAERGHRSYQTINKADVTADGVTAYPVGTTRGRAGPVSLGWRSIMSVATAGAP